MVNTLTLHQHTDLRLEAFARQLSEEWDVSIFVDFLVAQNMCLAPAKVACIEYPREPGKDDPYPWLCIWKAVWVADSLLGPRAQVRCMQQRMLASHTGWQAGRQGVRGKGGQGGA